MRVRYRKLTRSFDSKEYASTVHDTAEKARQRRLAPREDNLLDALVDNPRRHSALTEAAELAAVAVDGLASTPDKVQAEEVEAELDAVKELIRDGQLGPEDLVNLGDGWTTIRACVPLSDLATQGEGDVGRALWILVPVGVLVALLVWKLLG